MSLDSGAKRVDEARPIRAARGDTLRTKGWRTEGLLRLLENVLEVGERPRDLVVYAALAKAARDWPSYYAIVDALKQLTDVDTLIIQSGKPIGIFRTHPDAPRVLMANSNLVGRWATAEHFYELEQRGKIAWGGLTAGAWQYIGFQGVIQGTFETFAAVARDDFGTDDLKGKWVVTAGLGGMGSAQPLAVKLLGGVALVAEVNAARAREKAEAGLVDHVVDDMKEAIAMCEQARAAGQALTVAWTGNAVALLEHLLQERICPDVVTDMTSAHDALYGYHPMNMTLEEAAHLRETNPTELMDRARRTMVRHVQALLAFQERDIVVFDYGNNLRSQALAGGVENAFDVRVFTDRYLRPLFCRGIGPFRWVALSGDPADIAWIDAQLDQEMDVNEGVRRWIRVAKEHVPFQGLPARIAWLGHGERTALALRVNEAVAKGLLAGPVAFTRDHLDAGGMAHPNIMTENLADGTDAVADWPLLNAMLNTASGADLVAIHSGGGGYAGYMTSAGVTVIADGTEGAAARLERVMTADTGLGVLRYADAGYDEAKQAAQSDDLRPITLKTDGEADERART